MNTKPKKIIETLHELSDSDTAAHSQRFFKTGKGDYGEGDLFLGIRVPVIRKCVRKYRDLAMKDTLELLKSPFHEARLLALLILVEQYSSATSRSGQTAVYRAYLGNTHFINNWDLVDTSAAQIVGAHLFSRKRKLLYRLARSKSLWERRISIIATFHFIRRNDFQDTLALSELLLDDREDLIHKAVGWMLREVGNRNREVEEEFLEKYYTSMPRTMLRYAIEKFPESRRLAYLYGKH
jgi:3-methyladenine DNA glycosylase AlkD